MALSLEQRLDFEADPWEHQPGDKIIGEVVEVTSYEDKFNTGKTYPVVDLLTDPDTITGIRVYGSRTVLCNELRRLDPQPGDRLAVKYLGRQGKTGAEYEGYKVMLERAAPNSPRLSVVPSPADPVDDGDGLDEERRMEARHFDTDVDGGGSVWPDAPLPDAD